MQLERHDTRLGGRLCLPDEELDMSLGVPTTHSRYIKVKGENTRARVNIMMVPRTGYLCKDTDLGLAFQGQEVVYGTAKQHFDRGRYAIQVVIGLPKEVQRYLALVKIGSTFVNLDLLAAADTTQYSGVAVNFGITSDWIPEDPFVCFPVTLFDFPTAQALSRYRFHFAFQPAGSTILSD